MTETDRSDDQPGPASSPGPASALVGLRAAAWELVAHPIWICDAPTGQVVAANGAALQLLGVNEEGLRGLDLASLDTDGTLQDAARQALEEDGVTLRARVLGRGASAPMSVVGSASSLSHAGGSYVCFAVRSFHERTPSDKDLDQAQRLESIGLLAGGIAHDFNNLLTGVLGQVSLALAVLPGDSPARKPINKAAAAAGRAADLTRQLLAYAGKGQFQIQSIAVNELIIENIGLFETMLPKGVRLDLELAPEVPAILADRGQVQQVLMNLVLNAAEAMSDEGGSVAVHTSAWDGIEPRGWTFVETAQPVMGSHVVIEISDTGSGMSTDTLGRIFDPFYSTKGSGRGLGLSAALGVMRTHGGGLAVSSEVGSGTSFAVLLPSESGHAAEASPTHSEAQVPATSQTRVLIVDDEPAVREATTDMLELAGMSVRTADDGRDGVACFQQHQHEIDVVLLDMKMPVMDGEAAFHEMRALDPQVAVVLMSGYNESEATRQFGNDAPDAFLQKPFEYQKLVAVVLGVVE